MKSEKPKIIEMFDKLPKVITSCENIFQLIVAQKYAHLAYKKFNQSKVLRGFGNQLLRDKHEKLKNGNR